MSPALAKDWSPAQQEVIDRVEWCYDRWLDAFDKKNVGVYFDACAEDGSLLWFTVNGAPSTQDRAQRMAPGWSRMKNIYWEDFYPLEVRIHGDTAFVYSVSTWVVELTDGETNRVERRELYVYHKEGGTWRMIEGMVSPVN
jgi:ketosteroid isomerase-like protein